MQRLPSDHDWTHGRVATLPKRWADRLLKQWHESNEADYRQANVELRESTETLLALRIPLDASDLDICEAASQLASRCAGRAEIFHTLDTLRAAMERVCIGQGIAAPPAKVKDRNAIARMTCSLWWRSKLRKHHGRTLEASAIRLGLVSKARDLYVSQEGVRARIQQNARNAASLEATIARNELGQEFTLAELSAKGTSNKRIRRAELMTRISGFERIAKMEEHTGLFLTLTCPSRFHRFRTVAEGSIVIPNPNYDPTETPRTAQKYLARVWARIRADLKRRDMGVYGFRIAEPQHDGTPHWHLLLFCAAANAETVETVFLKHALKDSPDEPGARDHRCDMKRIDWSKGSAAGYVAKYISKNIDGEHVGEDLNGGAATDTAVRVEAWAARWGIRQFQQIGGAPVGVWRELRRVREVPQGAPRHLRDAHEAANKQNSIEGRDALTVSWDKYCEAQGGVFCGRNARIKLAMREAEKRGLYGDDPALRAIGVVTTELEPYVPGGGQGVEAERLVYWIVESERQQWEILRKPRISGSSFAERAQPAQPWTRVNNCTVKSETISYSCECIADNTTAVDQVMDKNVPKASNSERWRPHPL